MTFEGSHCWLVAAILLGGCGGKVTPEGSALDLDATGGADGAGVAVADSGRGVSGTGGADNGNISMATGGTATLQGGSGGELAPERSTLGLDATGGTATLQGGSGGELAPERSTLGLDATGGADGAGVAVADSGRGASGAGGADNGNTSMATSGAAAGLWEPSPSEPVTAPLDCAQVPQDVVAWWPGDGSTSDLGGGQSGELVGSGSYSDHTSGFVQEAFALDGEEGSVLFSNAIGNFGTSDFTIEFWLSTTETRRQAILEKREVCDALSFWGVRQNIYTVGTLFFELIEGMDRVNEVQFETASAVNDGRFHHVALTRQGSEALVYIDGRLDAQRESQRAVQLANEAQLTVGSSVCSWGDGGTHPLNGMLDELTLYDRALPAREVQAIFDAGTAGKCKPGL